MDCGPPLLLPGSPSASAGRVEKRHRAVPARAKDLQRRRRRDHVRLARTGYAIGVPARRPSQQLLAQREPGLAVVQDERAVGQVAHAQMRSCALAVEPLVDVIRSTLADDLHEAVVVLAAALGARPVAGCERGGLVEEEEARIPAGRHRVRAVAAPELEPARDPALYLELPPYASIGVVEAAAIAVDESPFGHGDQVAERRHAVPAGHRPSLIRANPDERAGHAPETPLMATTELQSLVTELRRAARTVRAQTRYERDTVRHSLAKLLDEDFRSANVDPEGLAAIRAWTAALEAVDVGDLDLLQELLYGIDALVRVHLWREAHLPLETPSSS